TGTGPRLTVPARRRAARAEHGRHPGPFVGDVTHQGRRTRHALTVRTHIHRAMTKLGARDRALVAGGPAAAPLWSVSVTPDA
ncbi:hypothetical protein N4G69_50555, partial [Streptomyces mirabilis]|nr:hypothetical protein [Streptomyces mirabilis]